MQQETCHILPEPHPIEMDNIVKVYNKYTMLLLLSKLSDYCVQLDFAFMYLSL